MDPEYKKKINDILFLLEETHTDIKKIRRTQKVSQIFSTIYWVFIIILACGGLYFLQPYLNVLNIYSGGVSGLQQAASIKSAANQKK